MVFSTRLHVVDQTPQHLRLVSSRSHWATEHVVSALVAPQEAEADRVSSRQPPRLLDLVRAAIRVRHYSLRTEHTYVYWIKRFIVFHGKRHPKDMGGHEIGQFLSALAVE